MHDKKELTKNIWQQKKYLDTCHKASLDFDHPAMKELMHLSKNAHKILDMGCGEGTRLGRFGINKYAIGVDISKTSIATAKKQYPKITFQVADLEELPLKDKEFDLVYSAYVLEHLQNPEKVLLEAMRVLHTKGQLLLVAPNYGAPNRSSPNFVGSRIKKLITGVLHDLQHQKRLHWNAVEPRLAINEYTIDTDTTLEPYLGSLVQFLKSHQMKITKSSSCWDQELPNASLLQKIFAFLGRIGVYPFWMWGPHLLVVAEKI
jgi:ubiquinone/menaquinone biosynthesis C-methylase UbiE